jgi:beta-lactam-binding protein with PASTA domain
MGIYLAGMASDPEEVPAADDTIVISGDGEDTRLLLDDEVTQAAEEEWPVAEFYRVEQDDVAPAPHESRDVVIATQSVPATAGGRRFPPPVGPALALILAGAVGAIILAVIAINLLRDGDQDARTGAPTSSSSSPVTNPSTPSPAAPSGATTLVDLKGMSLQEARPLLEKAGLRTRVRQLESDRPRGEILNQSPAAGAEVEKNRLVVLVVSRGAQQRTPESANVPGVVGLAASEAVVALRDAGFDVRMRLIESSETAGSVIRQSPAADAQASRGSEIVLDIAKVAPAAAPQRLEVPDVAGLTASAARRALEDAGFTVTVVRVHSEEPVGTVVTQSPRAGAELRKGAAVTLRVSSGPATVDVPDVIGLDEQSARVELESAGFHVRVIDEPTIDAETDGVVVGQSPPAGSAADEGGVVTITVGRLD